MTLHVAIVGAGLGGLAAALFLRKVDIDVTVYEQACELHEVERESSSPIWSVLSTSWASRPSCRNASRV